MQPSYFYHGSPWSFQAYPTGNLIFGNIPNIPEDSNSHLGAPNFSADGMWNGPVPLRKTDITTCPRKLPSASWRNQLSRPTIPMITDLIYRPHFITSWTLVVDRIPLDYHRLPKMIWPPTQDRPAVPPPTMTASPNRIQFSTPEWT
ncbi:hypothetical protein BV25DRAFT_1036159 [Artomyces pyxidatus]|uniref:Uncharacterized protein n=1 Tax=Artomyces pyxidatus TaxID=48021 RepID=A0ACB8SUI6_9AGAM|nr:hypothetical protein BV25DRAFT_1036159 [Artomyces pyxidatus]